MLESYDLRMRVKAEALRNKKHARILAVESSCDETAIAVVEDGRTVRANAIASQIDVHALYGGVVPEIASRMHVEAIRTIRSIRRLSLPTTATVGRFRVERTTITPTISVSTGISRAAATARIWPSIGRLTITRMGGVGRCP